jgi:thioredoxin 1
MAIITLHTENFEDSVSGEGIVVVDCWARWCGACKTFRPVYERIAGKHPEITFGSLNTGAEKSLVSKLGIEHIPTLLLYRDGILLFQQPGYYGEEEVEDILRQAETLDMDLVRSEIVAGRKKPDVKTATNKEDHNDGEKVHRAHDQFEMDQGKVGDDLFVSSRGS